MIRTFYLHVQLVVQCAYSFSAMCSAYSVEHYRTDYWCSRVFFKKVFKVSARAWQQCILVLCEQRCSTLHVTAIAISTNATALIVCCYTVFLHLCYCHNRLQPLHTQYFALSASLAWMFVAINTWVKVHHNNWPIK
jgi:hypothetical protein